MQSANATQEHARKPLRVLIAHRYFWPENLSLFAPMLRGIAEWHLRRGHVTTVLSPRATDASDQATRVAWAGGVGVKLRDFSLSIDRGRHTLVRIAHTLLYCARLAAELTRGKHDLVIVGSYPPVASAMVCRWCQWFKRLEYVYYVQDIHPEALGRSDSHWKRLLGASSRWIDTRNLRKAKRVITISDQMRQTLLRRGLPADKIVVLPNYSVDSPPLPIRGRPPSRLKLIFAGNAGRLQNLPHFLRAAHQAQQHRDFTIEILGGGRIDELKALAEREGIQQIEFSGCMCREAAQARIQAADIGVVAAAPGLYEVAYPSKSNSYLVSGLPVLVFTETNNPLVKELERDGLGLAASPNDVRDAAASIVELIDRVHAGDYPRDVIARRVTKKLSRTAYFATYAKLFPYEATISHAA